MTQPPSFVHLVAHTEYSLVDGLARVKPLVSAAAAAAMPAVAVTDQSNMFSLVKFYKAAGGAGVKPVFGADCRLHDPEDANNPLRLILLVRNMVGYGNLTRLLSRGYREGQHLGVPMLERAWLEGSTDGLVALSGGKDGDIGRALLNGHKARAEALLEDWLRLFGDRFYIEIRRTGRPGEEDYLHAAVELATARDVPVVATNDVRFIQREDFHAHEVRVCIHEGRTIDDPRRPKNYSEQQYLRTPEEMAELFSDIPEALENSVEIAKRCTLELRLGENFLPDFPIPEGMTEEAFFRAESWKGLEWRLSTILDRDAEDYAEQRKVYEERLEIELDVIIGMGFPGYFLIVADFIQWAKDNGVPVGPGRGSGAGSLVAYVLKITDLDPIEHDLLFERFLNPERVSMPDFDVDFCMEGRDRVIDYVARKYGRDSVSQIITYGSMAAKAVVRDVGRVLGHPYGFVDRIAKMIPFEVGMTLTKALEESEDLKKAYDNEEEVTELIDMGLKLEGLARNAGKHAGGVVISPGLLTDFTPLYCEAGSQQIVTQFDKDDVEQVGLVKFDFLGLRTLTIVDWALKTINAQQKARNEPQVDINAIPMDDEAAFRLLKACNTTAVFQLESRGMKELIKKLQPDCFDDITALVALFRPGPLQSGMVDDFIDRKHGRAKVEYPHPDLEPILKPTYGVILYQEQVMQIAQVLAGYSLGGADLLRRAMGKKKAEEMAKQGEIFRKGAMERGVDEGTAKYIFDLMEKFAGYGFNKTVAAGTLVATARGFLPIEEVEPDDTITSINPDGASETARVVALHDHGKVPLWEVYFDDGTVERCTLDHKWLTRHGQLPLWHILELGEAVWGVASDQAAGFSGLFQVPQTPLTRNPHNLVPTLRVGTPPAKLCVASGDWQTTSASLSANTRTQRPPLPTGGGRGEGVEHGAQTTIASTVSLASLGAERPKMHSHAERGNESTLPLPAGGGRGEGVEHGNQASSTTRHPLPVPPPTGEGTLCSGPGGDIVHRHIQSIRFLGIQQGYDLEVDHPQHNFVLASGLCCSNSHSAAYALVSYHTMYLKAHYPAAFMAAVLSADMDHTDKVVGLIEDTKAQHLKVNPPNVNASQYKFTIEGDDTVIYGLGAIKGVGEGAILGIVEERERNGPYADLFDFCRRIDLKKANRRVLESLIKAGALDGLGENRATLMAHLPLAIQMAEQHHASQAAGQIDLFAMDDQHAAPPPEEQLLPPAADEWEDEERLRAEKETLGLYLTGHPIDRYESELKELGVTRIANLSLEEAKAASGWGKRNKGQSVLIAGLVMAVSHRKTQRGRMGSVTLDDRTGRTEVTLFGDTYETYRDNLAADKVLVISGNLSYDDYREALSIRAENVLDIDEARQQWAHRIQLNVDLSRLLEQRITGAQLAAQLKELLRPFTGGACQILLRYQTPQAESVIELGQNWRIRPNDMLLRKLQKLFGEEGVVVSYRKPSFAGKEEQAEPRRAMNG